MPAVRHVPTITLRGAREHNLAGFDLEIPRGRLTVVTGVSGSGKSSLAFDTLLREGQRRFLELVPSYARQFAGGFRRPAILAIEGLGPAVAVSQVTTLSNPRSTVGTMTEVWDLLRLLYARLGEAPEGLRLSRGLFGWNGEGACPGCRGLGVEDRLDPELLVADAAKTIREGALRVSTPNGYLMYSQVTLAVLDEVLHAHGGSVDVPWRELSDEARGVVLNGSDRLLVPFGKHPLENRLKWQGITARPREEGHYRGLLPVMEEILRGKRNDSILRFVRSSPCRDCGGSRLAPEARSVRWRGRSITELAALGARELHRLFAGIADPGKVLGPIREELLARCALMDDLGLGDLAFDRGAPTLSTAEARRLRLLTLSLGELRGLLVVLDEPSAGLHPRDVARLLRVLCDMRDRGQTVVVVDHDPQLARAADWLVDLGPGPGAAGGRLLFAGPPDDLLGPDGPDTPTRRWLLEESGGSATRPPRKAVGAAPGRESVLLAGLSRNNVVDASLLLLPGALNLVTGVAGAGKSSLLLAAVERLRGDAAFPRVVVVDADPIGRTPRSNPATYTGAFDLFRDLFAATPQAKARGFGKGHFSFNTAGGRCESCEGAGVHEVGMRYLGSVDLVCDACAGRRFHPDVLEVRLDGLSIADVLEGSVEEAASLFRTHRRLARILDALVGLGLGYLPLGQPATTLSGGEAQRVKLATELARAANPALVVLDEPTTGLHAADVAVLVTAFEKLCAAGHTLLVADADLGLVRAADRVTELGPGSGPDGGRVVVAGSLEELVACAEAPTGAALRGEYAAPGAGGRPTPVPRETGRDGTSLELSGVTTHNLRGVTATFPVPGFTVVTGPSGSGKSSLVFDTLLAESQARFADLVSPWARRFLPMCGGAELEGARGLMAAVAVPSQAGRRNPRTTVGTVTEIDELLRLLFARAGSRPCPRCGRDASGPACACGERLAPLWAADFSPHAERGACPACRGLGFLEACDPSRLVVRPELPLDGGAIDGTRFGAYLAEAEGQHMATLRAAAAALGLSVSGPWRHLSPEARGLAMDGAGERLFEVAWEYRRGRRTGVHRFASPWKGLARLVETEYERVHADERGEELEPLLVARSCAVCGGERLKPAARAVVFAGRRAPEAMALDADALAAWLDGPEQAGTANGREPVTGPIRVDLRRRVEALRDSGLGYLSPSREVATLSGGEAQRVRLSAALGGGLVGVTYVLDEPTQGLHPRDTARLAAVLRGLAGAGNAVVVVEHDASLVAAADHVVELGPGAGPDGGRIVASGAPSVLRADPSSYTGRLLSRGSAAARRPSRPLAAGVTVKGAHLHNLKDVDVELPAGGIVVVAGVSGSGKSTLVLDVLAPSLRAAFRGEAPIGCRALELGAPLAEVLASDQDGLVVGGASTVATLAGVAEGLRRRFAATPEAKARRIPAKAFSTVSPGGRCETCAGRGLVTVSMDLLPDVTVGCEACGGRRFSDDVLACSIDGRNLTDVLDAPVSDVAAWFAADRAVTAPLLSLREIGLGYLRLGQEGGALSSGERQRLRLARLLSSAPTHRTAVLLDEPTRGLGFEDVDRLLAVLDRLAAAGHLVVVVEHHPGVLAAADWLVELGPEGGERGGRVVRAGTP